MKPCCICRTPVQPFIAFGRMPMANGFLTPDEFASESFYDLGAGVCPLCQMVQLTQPVEPGKLFHEQYAFYSSTSARMVQHFQKLAESVRSTHLTKVDPFVLEIGSNDGALLQHFARTGIRHLGIEPSANVTGVARGKGVQTICDFFNEALARRIVSEHGQADVILATNVMCHMLELESVVAGIRLLLKPHAVLIFEDPYLGDIIQKAAYDQIYDEHAFYFSVTSLDYLFREHALDSACVTATRAWRLNALYGSASGREVGFAVGRRATAQGAGTGVGPTGHV